MLNNLTLYTAPLTAALVAHDTAVLTRNGTLQMITPTPRWRNALLLPTIIGGIAMASSHAAMTISLLVWGEVTQPQVGWNRIALTLLIQCATFFAVAFIGGALGRYANIHTSGLLAFAAVFLLAILPEIVPSGSPWLLPGGATAPQIGYVWSLDNQILRIIQIIVVCALAWYTIAFHKTDLRSGGRRAALPLIALCAATITGLALPTTEYKAISQPSMERESCSSYTLSSGNVLSICLFREHKRYLETVGGNYAEAYELLLAAGVPQRYLPLDLEEAGRLPTANEKPSDLGSVTFPLQGPNVKPVPLTINTEMQQSIANTLSIPMSCRSSNSQTFNELVESQDKEVLASWDTTFTFILSVFNGEQNSYNEEDFVKAFDHLSRTCS
jgi:hypothetical protein